MGVIAACATFMMLMCATIPCIVWFDEDIRCSRTHGNDIVKKITIMCLMMFVLSGTLFSWAMYHITHPITSGTYIRTSYRDDNNNRVETINKCTNVTFGNDPCWIVKRITTPYEIVYGTPIIETFGE